MKNFLFRFAVPVLILFLVPAIPVYAAQTASGVSSESEGFKGETTVKAEVVEDDSGSLSPDGSSSVSDTPATGDASPVEWLLAVSLLFFGTVVFSAVRRIKKES